MTKESTYELQKIDCNCNDCAFMIRDLDAYNKNLAWDKETQQQSFDEKKAKAIAAALDKKDRKHKGWEESLKSAQALKHTYTPQKVGQLYGSCSKLNKPVTFLANTLQLDTQSCFTHRKDQ